MGAKHLRGAARKAGGKVQSLPSVRKRITSVRYSSRANPASEEQQVVYSDGLKRLNRGRHHRAQRQAIAEPSSGARCETSGERLASYCYGF